MGFGLSDEIMEQIRDSMWYDPEFGLTACYKHPLGTNDYYTSIGAEQRYYYPEEITYTDLSKEEMFFASVYKNIFDVEGKFNFTSDTIQNRFKSLLGYYKNLINVLKLDSQKVLEAADSSYDKSAGNILLDNIIDSIFPFIDSAELSKADFRDIADDVCNLSKKWGIAGIEEISDRAYFFNLIKAKYGLTESKMFCCPFCGKPLVTGIAFCPNCLENSRDKVTPRYSPNNNVIAIVDAPADNRASNGSEVSLRAKLQETEKEKLELAKEIKWLKSRSKSTNDTNQATIANLLESVRSLSIQLEEKKREITALQLEYNEPEVNTNTKKNVLIFGASTISSDELLCIADEVGLTDVNFVFKNDYAKLKQFASRVKKDSSYVGIIVGPTPHKIKEGEGTSNPITYFRGEGFPFVVEAKTYSGELKITRQSARSAFSSMFRHLISTGYYS